MVGRPKTRYGFMILVYIAAAWAAGIVLAALLALPGAVWLWLAALPLGYLVIWWRDRDVRRFHLILLAIVLGALRYQSALPGPAEQALAEFNDKGASSLLGLVAAEPDTRDAYTDLRIDVTRIQHSGAWKEIVGRAIVRTSRDTPARYGDQVQVAGDPTSPPDAADFSYRGFLARQSIFTLVDHAEVYVVSHDHGNPIWKAIFEFKSSALQAIAQLFPEPSASLLSGILLGNDRGIPSDTREAFNLTNTSHIIAISGFNIAILALYLGWIARRAFSFRPSLADWFVILLLIGYTLLVGAGASVVRAAIMGILGVIAVRFGRQAFALTSLAAAALVMTVLNPFALWDLGFQLSFLATLGLLLCSAPLTRWFERRTQGRGGGHSRRIIGLLSDSLIVTLAAWIFTTPILLAVFHRLSIVGLLTNLLVLPAQPPIMILGGLATVAQVISNALSAAPVLPLLFGAFARVIGTCAYVFLQYTILVVEWTARVPFGSFELSNFDWMAATALYTLILAATLVSPRRLVDGLLSNPALGVGFVAFASVLVWTSAVAAPDSRTHIQFIATKNGSAVLVRTAKDSRILIDGSKEPSALLAHLGEQLPFWDRRLDLVVATNLDDQYLASLNAVLERFAVGQVMTPPAKELVGVSLSKWRILVKQNGIREVQASAGTRLQADEVTVDVLYPAAGTASTNAVLRLSVGGHGLLIASSAQVLDLRALTSSEVALASETAVLPAQFDKDLLGRVNPKTVIFFAGRNMREQPSLETLKLLEQIDVLRIQDRGTIELVVDGDRLSVLSEK